MISHMDAQGLSSADLRTQAAEVLSHLTQEQVLEVLAYARSLEIAAAHRDHVLEDLLDEDVH